jgi:hypothetical protein
MPLTFTKTHVVPGEPVTAQAWNAIVDGLFEAQAVLLTGSGTVRVTLTGDARDIAAARVVATDVNGVRYDAVPQTAPGDPFVFPKLTVGAYTVAASAPSCTTATAGVTIGIDGTVTPNPIPLALVSTAKRMPNVLGVKWKDAVGQLQPVNARALDASGKGVPLAGFDAAYNDAPVLMQWPDPEEIVPAGKDPYVVVATIIKPTVLIPTPNFIGMTVTAAQTEAAKHGLVLKIT